MNQNRSLTRALLVVVLFAAPALTIRAISEYYGDQNLLPLAQTRETRAETYEGSDSKGFARIDVRVEWPRGWTGSMTQQSLKDVISNTLKHQTEYYRIEFIEQMGEQIEVTFDVGPNSYGPFPPGRMLDGIETALVALRMTNGPEVR